MIVATVAKRCALLLAACVLILAADKPASQKPIFWSRATISETDGNIAVRANDPRPLDQAIIAIRQKCGWIVDYEDPPYGSNELVDDTDPDWRKTHPEANGVTRVAGGLFITTFSSGDDMSSGSLDEKRALDKVVADYEASANPGRFTLKTENDNRFSIVGVGAKGDSGDEKAVAPVLDSRISLPVQERTVSDSIHLILRVVSEKSEYKVLLGSAPLNLVLQTKTKIGGENLPARQLLAQAASATRFPLVWALLYDADTHCYFMNFDVAMEATGDGSGTPHLKPIPKR